MKELAKFVLVCAVFSVCDGKALKLYYNVTEEEYYKIPPVFQLDDYDECLNKYKDTLYCYTALKLQPNNPESPPESWKIIKELISVPRTYRHDRIRHGICIPKKCPNIPITIYSGGNGSAELQKSISECYTDILKDHELTSTVEKMMCESRDNFYKIDWLDIIYGIVVGVFLVLIVAGTYYEGKARLKPNSGAYNAMGYNSITGKILFAFSIRKNFERLRNANTSDIAVALSPIQGIRVYNMLLVIMCHTIMLQMYGPVLNTVFVEDTPLKPENVIVSNGALIIQTYFVISGWLLSYTFMVLFQDKKRVRLRHLVLALLHRYIRLAPIFLLVVGFNATWLRHFTRGPAWQHYVGDEYKNCRRNWWINMLFINNYLRPEEMCIQQSWYLASDTQCFILGLIIMMIVINKPWLATQVFTGTIAIGISLAIGISYYNDYDIVQRNYPETMYTLFLEDHQWLDTYIRGHFAIPSYVQGLAYGYWFYFMKRDNTRFITSNYTRLAWIIYIWAAPLTTILIAIRFNTDGFEVTRLMSALYHGTYKYIFGMSIGLAIFGFSLGEGGVMVPTLTWPPLQVLARTSFTVYLTHVTVLRMKYGSLRSPTYLTNFNLFVDTIGDFWTSILFGTLVCLTVEMPISALQKIATTSRKDDSNNNNNKKNTKTQ